MISSFSSKRFQPNGTVRFSRSRVHHKSAANAVVLINCPMINGDPSEGLKIVQNLMESYVCVKTISILLMIVWNCFISFFCLGVHPAYANDLYKWICSGGQQITGY